MRRSANVQQSWAKGSHHELHSERSLAFVLCAALCDSRCISQSTGNHASERPPTRIVFALVHPSHRIPDKRYSFEYCTIAHKQSGDNKWQSFESFEMAMQKINHKTNALKFEPEIPKVMVSFHNQEQIFECLSPKHGNVEHLEFWSQGADRFIKFYQEISPNFPKQAHIVLQALCGQLQPVVGAAGQS